MCFARENQDSWDWSVDREGAVWSACRDEEMFDLVVVNESLDRFLQGFLLREAIFGSKFLVSRDAAAFEAPNESLLMHCSISAGDSSLYLLNEHILANREVDTWWFGSNERDPAADLSQA